MTTIPIQQRIDARGLSCPMPIVKTAQAVKTVAIGDAIEVVATDPGSVKDFEAWATATGNELVESDASNGTYRYVIVRRR